VARARKLKTDRLQSGFSQNIKIARALETKHKLNLEHDEKAQKLLGSLNSTVENSRVMYT